MMRFLLVVTLGLFGCTHSLHTAHFSDFSPTYAKYQQGELVAANTSQFVILGFVTETNYVNLAYAQLQSKCSGGQLQGIETEHWTDHGFFSWTNRIRMQGLCIR